MNWERDVGMGQRGMSILRDGVLENENQESQQLVNCSTTSEKCFSF